MTRMYPASGSLSARIGSSPLGPCKGLSVIDNEMEWLKTVNSISSAKCKGKVTNDIYSLYLNTGLWYFYTTWVFSYCPVLYPLSTTIIWQFVWKMNQVLQEQLNQELLSVKTWTHNHHLGHVLASWSNVTWLDILLSVWLFVDTSESPGNYASIFTHAGPTAVQIFIFSALMHFLSSEIKEGKMETESLNSDELLWRQDIYDLCSLGCRSQTDLKRTGTSLLRLVFPGREAKWHSQFTSGLKWEHDILT